MILFPFLLLEPPLPSPPWNQSINQKDLPFSFLLEPPIPSPPWNQSIKRISQSSSPSWSSFSFLLLAPALPSPPWNQSMNKYEIRYLPFSSFPPWSSLPFSLLAPANQSINQHNIKDLSFSFSSYDPLSFFAPRSSTPITSNQLINIT